MLSIPEFYIPAHPSDLEDPSKYTEGHYHLETVTCFEIPSHQQLDDLGRLFDALLREKSPTALFANPELFRPLFSYIKTIQDKKKCLEVTRAARHRICHEVGERMKKLLQAASALVKKKKEKLSGENEMLSIHLRSTLKMFVFTICNVLLSNAPVTEDDENISGTQQRNNRKRKRREVTGFGDDESGVDMDGRELALNALLEFCSQDVTALWSDHSLEQGTLHLIFKMCLHMITQKANIGEEAQSISSGLSLLLARVTNALLLKNELLDPLDLVSPMVELALKSDCAALFLSKFVSDIEQEEFAAEQSEKLLQALFEGMANAALNDAPGDSTAAKNISIFFGEVARKCVSATVKMQDVILPILQSENYDVRKTVVTCIAEIIVQKYSGLSKESSNVTRNQYLNELVFRTLDINPFVRNHVLHVWEKLIDAKVIPKKYYLTITQAIVGRLEDKNYLVRDSALAAIVVLVRKNWFGPVLNRTLLSQKMADALGECATVFANEEKMNGALLYLRKEFEPREEGGEDLAGVENTDASETNISNELPNLNEQELMSANKVLFYENALSFLESIKEALHHAVQLLDSKTERDVIESIKLIVSCIEYHVEEADISFLKVLVLVFMGEVKIQLAVRDAFVEVIFNSVARLSSSAVTRATICAQKLISILKNASEGEVSAVERIFSLLKSNPVFGRHISNLFLDAIWGIAEGSLDQDATIEDRRTAMRIYSLLSKFFFKDLRIRHENLLEYLNSDRIKDNTILSYVFQALEHESLDPQFVPISASVDPKDHPILKCFITHLCRTTTSLGSWMSLANAAVSAIHNLCEVPVVIFTYILQYIGDRVERNEDINSKAQLFYLVGLTALKQLVSVETAERLQLKALEESSNKTGSSTAGEVGGVGSDSMHKELGFGTQECRRHAIQDMAQKRKAAILSSESIWSTFSDKVISCCRLKPNRNEEVPFERIAAVMALCHLMIVSETFCAKNLNLLFTIVANKHESWVIKTNIVIALGDLACVHPNLLGPYLKEPTTGFFKLLVDDDVRVRAVTIQVCSHLVLGEMLRIRDHLYTIVKLVADPDERIAKNAETFVQNLAMKEKEKTGNLIPPLVTQLSSTMPTAKFQQALRTLLERVEGDKPTDSLIERLCQRFEAYSEKSKKRLNLARNIAFCLSELHYNTERSTKRITSESCFQQYRLWLRDPEVLEYFRAVAAKARRSGGRTGTERKDKTIIEEWEARMLAEANIEETEQGDDNGFENQEEEMDRM